MRNLLPMRRLFYLEHTILLADKTLNAREKTIRP